MSRLLLSDSVQPIDSFEFEFGTEEHQFEVDQLSRMLIASDQGICFTDPLSDLFGQLSVQSRNIHNQPQDMISAATFTTVVDGFTSHLIAFAAKQEEFSAKQLSFAEAIQEIPAIKTELKAISANQSAYDASLRSMQVAAKSAQSIFTPRASTQFFESFFESIEEDNEYFDQIAFKVDDPTMSKIWKQFCANLLKFDRDVRVYNQDQTDPRFLAFKRLFSKRNPRFSSEAECQAFMNVVFEILCDLLPDRTVDWRDTSMSTYAPSNPLYKFDASFVRKGSVSSEQSCVVDWNDEIFFGEYKKAFTATLFRAGLMQLVNGVAELTSKQTYCSEESTFGRTAGIAFLSDGFEVQFVEFTPGNTTMSMMRSKRMLLFPSKKFSAQDPVPTGFSFLVRFLMTNPRTLHYIDHGAKKLEGAFASSDIDSKMRAHRIMHKGKPDVFFVTPVDQSVAPFVVKRYSNPTQYRHELNIYKLDGLTALQKRHFPELLSSHESSLTIAIRPLAQSSIFENRFSMGLMKEVIRAGLHVLPLLHGRGLIHGDISSGNILVCDCNADGQYRVVINDFSHTLKLGLHVSEYFGTRVYSSLRMDEVVLFGNKFEYGPIDDWQSFALVLLEFCLVRKSSSELVVRLPWASSHLLAPDAFIQKRAHFTDSAMLDKLLSASSSCLDRSGLEFMKELIATLFQASVLDDQSRVATAISMLNLFVLHEPSREGMHILL
jgi:hypothetical protein